MTSDDDAPIAAFDFDGTITTKDSFTTFLAWRTSRARYLAGLAGMSPAILAYLANRDRGRLKASAVATFLRGTPRDALEDEAEAFASANAPRLFRPDAIACWEDWGRKGARRVIVTASPAILVAPFAQRLGADALIGTELAFDGADKVAGAFTTANCRGPEKVARLRATFGADVRLAAAYGDTSGDKEMLELAEIKGFRVFTESP